MRRWKEQDIIPLALKHLEKKLKELDLDHVAALIHETLQANPWSGTRGKMWEEQCLVNFPLLYLGSLILHDYGQKRGCDTYLFATRDGCYWHRIFSALFPEAKVHYFDCSRNMLEGATVKLNPAYNEYVASLLSGGPGKAVYVDIHGTGKRMFNYFSKRFLAPVKKFDRVPYCFLLTAVEPNMNAMPEVTRKWYDRGKVKVLSWRMRGGPIEMLNYDLIGTLQNYTFTDGIPRPVRDALEYSHDRVKPYHNCMDQLVANIQPAPSWEVPKKREILDLIDDLAAGIQRTKPAISKYIEHEVHHRRRH